MNEMADNPLDSLYGNHERSYLDSFEEYTMALTGLPIDQALFLMTQIVSVPFAFLLQYGLPASRVGESARHLFCLLIGLMFGVVCFRWQIFHVLIPTVVAYPVLMIYGKSEAVGRVLLGCAMLYLSLSHMYRQVFDYGSYKLDITGPLMIWTQKVSIIGWAYCDGQKPDSELTNDDHRKHKVDKLPSFLAYCSYLMGFLGFQTGPCYFFNDYIEFMQGRHLVPFKKPVGDQLLDADTTDSSSNSARSFEKYPSPIKAFVVNLAACALCGLVVAKLCPLFPTGSMAKDDFIRDTSFMYKVVYCYLTCFFYRFRYYFAWKLGECISYAAGFGFSGWTEDGQEKWDLIKNCTLVKLETATSFKVVFDEWNKQTAKWLRFICYTRVVNKKHATNAVFLLSAFWHGFYPGYYVTFGQGMLFVSLGRKIRKSIRPFFQTSTSKQILYGLITFVGTHLALSFAVTAQILLRLSIVLKVYKSLYFYIVIISFALLFLPFPRPPGQPKKKEKGEDEEDINKPLENTEDEKKEESVRNTDDGSELRQRNLEGQSED